MMITFLLVVIGRACSMRMNMEQEQSAYQRFKQQYMPESDDYITPINVPPRT